MSEGWKYRRSGADMPQSGREETEEEWKEGAK